MCSQAHEASRDDVQCIVLDNLQFMMPRRGGGSSSGFEKFDLQDAVIDRFRAFATEKNVTIILVPRTIYRPAPSGSMLTLSIPNPEPDLTLR